MERQGLGFSDGVFLMFALFRNEKGVYSCMSNGFTAYYNLARALRYR